MVIWMKYIFNLLIAFAIGYLFAYIYRPGKPVASESASIEPELKYLEDQIEIAKAATTELINEVKLKRQSSTQSSSAKVVGFSRPEKRGKFKTFISKVFTGNSQTQETQDDPLIERLRQVKLDIKNIASEVESARLSLKSNQARRSGHEIPSNEKLYAQNTNPAAYDYEPNDTVATRMFDFDSPAASNQATSSTETDLPQIHRPGRSYQATYEDPGNRDTSRLSGANIASEIIELYNRAVTDMFAREQFRERYQPLRIGTVNAVERRQNPTIEAEFRETTDGNFFAFPINARDEYAVVPRLGLTIEAVSYSAGALGQVFNDPNYDQGLFYSRYRVRRPATFKRDGDRWELLSAGELDLGQGD